MNRIQFSSESLVSSAFDPHDLSPRSINAEIHDEQSIESSWPWEERALESAERTIRFLKAIKTDLRSLKFPTLPSLAKERAEKRVRVMSLLETKVLKSASKPRCEKILTPFSPVAKPICPTTAGKKTHIVKEDYKAKLLLDRVKSNRLKSLQVPVVSDIKKHTAIVRSLSPSAIPVLKKKKPKTRRIKQRNCPFFSSWDAVETACNLYQVPLSRYPFLRTGNREESRKERRHKVRELIDVETALKDRSILKYGNSTTGPSKL